MSVTVTEVIVDDAKASGAIYRTVGGNYVLSVDVKDHHHSFLFEALDKLDGLLDDLQHARLTLEVTAEAVLT